MRGHSAFRLITWPVSGWGYDDNTPLTGVYRGAGLPTEIWKSGHGAGQTVCPTRDEAAAMIVPDAPVFRPPPQQTAQHRSSRRSLLVQDKAMGS